MGIENFPAALQPAIQQGFLEREFQHGLRSTLAYRSVARREKIPNRVGETVTKTRAGLKAAVTTPMSIAGNTNLDNGLTPGFWTVEQYSLTMFQYGATMDLNMVSDRVGIASQFLQNAYANGEQASRSLDDMARNALFNYYLGGNTRVRSTLGSPGTAVSVDDIRGFQYVFNTAGFTSAAQILSGGSPSPTSQAVSSSNTLAVLVNANVYTLVGAAADTVNVSTAPGGISGVLTFSGNVTVADGTTGNTVQAANASVIKRPSARGNASLLQAGDLLTMSVLLDSVAQLKANGIPRISGAYNCYLDPVSARQLFADPDFRQLFQGATSGSAAFKSGDVPDFLGLRFIETTEALIQTAPSVTGAVVRRPIICGAETLVEGDFEGMAAEDVAPGDSIITVEDDIVHVTREPLDRLQQIIAQSWYWIGGFTAPSDITTNASTIPTASPAAYKRAVVIEHIG